MYTIKGGHYSADGQTSPELKNIIIEEIGKLLVDQRKNLSDLLNSFGIDVTVSSTNKELAKGIVDAIKSRGKQAASAITNLIAHNANKSSAEGDEQTVGQSIKTTLKDTEVQKKIITTILDLFGSDNATSQEISTSADSYSGITSTSGMKPVLIIGGIILGAVVIILIVKYSKSNAS